MKTLATYLKISFFFLVFIQVRVLKSVMFWKHNWDLASWLSHRNDDGGNDLISMDIALLSVVYSTVGVLMTMYYFTGNYALSILGYLFVLAAIFFIQKMVRRKI